MCVCVCVCVYALSHFSCVHQSRWDSIHGILSVGFSRREYWSGLPCPPLGDLPDPGIKFRSLSLLPWQAGSSPLAPPGKTLVLVLHIFLILLGPAVYLGQSFYSRSRSSRGTSLTTQACCKPLIASHLLTSHWSKQATWFSPKFSRDKSSYF